MTINLETRINLETLILTRNFQVGNIDISLETSILTWKHHYQVGNITVKSYGSTIKIKFPSS